MPVRRHKTDPYRYAFQAALGLVILGVFLASTLGRSGVLPGLGQDPATWRTDGLHGTLVPLLESPEFLTLAGTGLTLALVLPALSPLPASLLALVAMVPAVYLGYARPNATALVPMEYSLLTILILFAFKVLVSYLLETRDRERLTARFGQYVPPHLAQALSEDPEAFSMDGEAREMTVMFADIRNFTAMAERLDPRQLVQILNAVFTPLTEVVHRNRGTIDKYIGDAVMAFWGAPLRDPDHAQHAVLAAIEMQTVLGALQADLRDRGWPDIEVGIGVNAGTMSVGNMGSRYRVAYTVVGDAVNLAARVQALTRDLRADILVTEAVRQRTPGLVYREVGTLRVRGKADGFRLHQPVCRQDALTPALSAWLDEHAQALASYYARRWDEATTRFGRLWARHPEDRLYGIYLNNILTFTKGPTPHGWSGELDPDAPEGFGLAPPRRVSA